MKSRSIQFKYALDRHGHVVDVESFAALDRSDYECAGCGEIVRPVMGTKRKKHFRHKVQRECSLETYLHKMGKLLFRRTYSRCVAEGKPYWLEYPVPIRCEHCNHGPCDMDDEYERFDLAKKFIFIEEEERDGNVIPDLKISAKSGEKVYIEIAVTHKSTLQKIDSGARIIEFSIVNESHLEVFEKEEISPLENSVELFNFQPKLKIKFLPDKCSKYLTYFVVYPSGKCYPKEIQASKSEEIEKIEKGIGFLYSKRLDFCGAEMFIKEAERAFFNGVKVKNCFLCRYHAPARHFQKTEKNESIFCKFLKSAKESNDAADCESYRPDSNVFKNRQGYR